MKNFTACYYLLLSCFSSLIFISNPAGATHIRGAELTYHADTTNTSPLRYFFKLVVYHDANSSGGVQGVLDFGDGSTAQLNSTGKTLLAADPTIYRSVIYLEHQFPAIANYLVSFKETNRASGIVNIPNSQSTPMLIQSTVVMGLGVTGNHSPVFMAPIISTGVVGQVYRHNVTAYDRNGDSLAYKLVPALQNINQPLISYQFPAGITMNNRTGEIIWPQPDKVGMYGLTAEIREYRQGQLIGKVMRDFTVLILPVGEGTQVQIQNRSQLAINDRNQLFITNTDVPVKIRVAATNAKALDAYSELTALGILTNPRITADNPLEKEYTLNPAAALKRSLPYIITFRGKAATPTMWQQLLQQDLTLAVYFRPERATDAQNTADPGELTNPTGIGDPDEEAGPWDFKIYPNPVITHFKVDYKDQKPARLLLYNASSQLVLEQTITSQQTYMQRSSAIKPGIYFYIILTDAQKKAYTGKLLFL